MKTAIFQRLMISVLLIIGMLSSCKKESSESKSNGSVKFMFQNEVSEQKLKSTKIDSVSMPVAIIVSIETTNGEVIFDKEKLELINLDGKYITKALNMKVGTYNLTEFMVTDSNNTIIYATPKKGSKMESLVRRPLPFSFQISSDDINILNPEVIAAEGNSPDDFGYVSFSFNFVKNIKFLVSVIYKNESQLLSWTSANLRIKGLNQSSVNKIRLDRPLNKIYINDVAEKYILTIWNSGYFPWTDTLTAAQLAGYAESPLIVYLKPYDVDPFFISFQASKVGSESQSPSIKTRTPQKFYVEWGDGNSVKVTSPININHEKRGCAEDEHIIKIWGPVADIIAIGMWFCFGPYCNLDISQPRYSSIDISGAPYLQDLSLDYEGLTSVKYNNLDYVTDLGLGHSELPIPLEKFKNLNNLTFFSGGGYLDISKNTKLTTLNISSIDSISFGYSKVSAISVFGQFYSPELNTIQFNKILVELLANVKKVPRAGIFNCSLTPTLDGADAKLALIRDYRWSFPY